MVRHSITNINGSMGKSNGNITVICLNPSESHEICDQHNSHTLVFMEGEAYVKLGNDTTRVQKRQSVHVPAGIKACITNKSYETQGLQFVDVAIMSSSAL